MGGIVFFILVALFIVCVPLLFIGGIVFLLIRSGKGSAVRGTQMQTVANEMGWKYSPKMEWRSIPYANSFHLFAQGRLQRINQVTYGEAEGVQATVFSYTFARKWQSGQGSTRSQTVALLQSNQLNFPAFFLRPSSFRHKLGTTFSASISFPAHVAFSDQYLLSGNDDAGLRKLFSASALSFFEANPGWSMEGSGGQLFIYREDTLMPPQNIPWFVNEGLRVMKLLQNTLPVPASA